jgi:hypothetical protein
MSNNILNDISKVYLQTVVESSHLETDMKKRREANEKSIEDMKKTAAYKSMSATAAKKFDEALDPVGQEDSDIDNDGKKNTKSDKYLTNRRKVRSAIIQKEGFSNWRNDLCEVISVAEKEDDDVKITEKKVKNTIKINPSIKEAVEELGGTLLELVEINEDYLVEEINIAADYLYSEGLNEYGLDILIEELGLDDFINFMIEINEDYYLTEAVQTRLQKKAGGSIKSPKGVRAQSSTNAALKKHGLTRKISGGSSSTIKKERKSAVAKAVEKQPSKKPVRDAIARGIFGAVKAYQSGMERHKKAMGLAKETGKTVAKAAKVAHEAGRRAGESKVGQAVKKGASAAGKAVAKKVKSDIETTKKALKKEEFELDEKTLTAAETKKKEEIVKSMKKGLSGFKSRYGDRAKEVMYATATKQAKRVAEDVGAQVPLTPQELQKQKQKAQLDNQIAQLRKQSLSKVKKPEMQVAKEEFVDEARAEEKRGLGSTGAQRQRQKTKIGGIANPQTSYSGGQNPHLRGKEDRTKEQRRAASRRYVDQPGGIYAKPENKQGEGKYASMQAKKRPDLGSRFD